MQHELDDEGHRAQIEEENRQRLDDEVHVIERAHFEKARLDHARERARRNRLQFSTALMSILAGVVLLFIRNDLSELIYPASRAIVPAFGISLLATGAALIMLQYLRGAMSLDLLELNSASTISAGFKPQSARETEMERQISNLKDEITALRTVVDLSSALSSHSAKDDVEGLTAGVVARLEERLSDEASQGAHIKEIRTTFLHSRTRLEEELQSLGFRGNLNLVIGVLTSAIAIGLLAYMVLGSVQSFDNVPALLSHYVPRISVVLFIEIFSFFFLRLYRTTLLEIRIYQSDITNLCLKQSAVEAAWSVADPARASLSKDLMLSADTNERKVSESEKPAVDPKLVAELLQKFGEVIVKKGKKDD